MTNTVNLVLARIPIDVIPTSYMFSELWVAVKLERIVPHQILINFELTQADEYHSQT